MSRSIVSYFCVPCRMAGDEFEADSREGVYDHLDAEHDVDRPVTQVGMRTEWE